MLNKGKYMPSLFTQLAVFQCATLRIAEFKCFKLSLFKHYCVRANLRRCETVCTLQVKGKYTLVENNYVYSIFKLIEEQELVLTFIKRRSFAYINKHRHATSTSVDTVNTGLQMNKALFIEVCIQIGNISYTI